ncbi:FGGY-family carbohydrate kinase [Microbispora sp. ATCC PTA-5024]|uniref:FGGY-family carbohydrate kinase n=1 Tax=Microbispora sp. ATCC PTA-5024 TaxID=316330 RepID=UPI0003DDDDC5|nr:FGGY family carbohydrate kinase [Microbispora sp. ATCC PTA-5024]ETK34975.1 sugar kinase [Microbispora sp. ATCC PTA-5024]
MTRRAFLGVDIGTSSSKGVLVDEGGRLLASAVRDHEVSRPRPGHVEMDGELWWTEFRELAAELDDADVEIAAVGVSGMGPCVLLTGEDGLPLRPAILYGVDTRAARQIEELTAELGGPGAILDRCGSALSSQAVGPKLRWLAEHEPDVWSRARRLFMPASWLVHRLTGAYTLDYHSASQCTPMFDIEAAHWYRPWAERIAPHLELPALAWSDEVAGTTREPVAGIPAGTPVVTGTIDAWTEAVSVDAHNVGDLMLMYGTTMFLVATVDRPLRSPSMWGTLGAFRGTRSLAGGMATSGAVTGWLRDLVGAPGYAELLAEAEASGPGARGLLVLPYFAGERTPVQDPDARGVVAGLTLSHTRGDLYRAALEATALGVRHNVEALRAAGARVERVVAVGGGTRGGLWTRIVSDVTGLPQVVPATTIGAAYGAAHLAARTTVAAAIAEWNPPAATVAPDAALKAGYDELYALYRELYPATRRIAHTLAARQRMLA